MFGRFMVTLSRFMYGRYGVDQMFRGLSVVYLILWAVRLVIGVLTDWYTLYYILQIVMIAMFVWLFFRVFSRNIDARRRENEKYCAFVNKIGIKKNTSYNYAQGSTYAPKSNPKTAYDKKLYKYAKCRSCGATLRLRRRRGTHTATCPRCGNNVKVRSLW